MFIARVDGNPSTFPINIDGTVVNLSRIDEWAFYSGINSDIELDTVFAVSLTQPLLDSLQELVMVVKYSF